MNKEGNGHATSEPFEPLLPRCYLNASLGNFGQLGTSFVERMPGKGARMDKKLKDQLLA